jgi:hypothetical protein
MENVIAMVRSICLRKGLSAVRPSEILPPPLLKQSGRSLYLHVPLRVHAAAPDMVSKKAPMKTPVSLRIGWVLLCCVAASGSSVTALGADPVALVSTGGAFQSYFRQGAWAVRAPSLRNETDQPRRVKIIYACDDPARGRTNYSTVVWLPPHTMRRAYVGMRFPHLPRASTDEKSQTPQEIAVLWDDETLQRLSQPMRPVVDLGRRATIIAHVPGEGESDDTSGYLVKLTGDALEDVKKLNSQAVILPNRWYGYDMADLLILGDVDVQEMRPSQQQAILDWVRRGGTLVLAGGRMLPGSLEGVLGELAGVTATGYHRVTELRPTSPGQTDPPSTVELTWAAPMVELCVGDCEVLLTHNGLPLMTRRHAGDGAVFTLAAPLGAFQDPSLHSIWRYVRDAIYKEKSAIDNDAFLRPAQETLNGIAGRPAPSRTIPLAILLTMAGIAVVGGAALRLRRRGEVVWIVLAPGAIVCGLLLWVSQFNQSDPERLSCIGLLSGLDGPSARAQAVFAYYSGPETRDLDLSSGGSRNVIRDARKGDSASGDLETRSGAAMVLPDQTVQVRSDTVCSIDEQVDLDGVRSELTFGPDGLTGDLDNRLGHALSDCVLYANRRTYRVGDVPAGESTRITVGDDQLLGRVEFLRRDPAGRRNRSAAPAMVAKGQFTTSRILRPDDVQRNQLLGEIVTTLGVGKDVSGDPILIGYAADGPLTPLEEKSVEQRGWWVVAWPVRFTAPPRGGKVTIPEGFVDLKLENVGSQIWNRLAESFIRTSRGGELLLRARPPHPVGLLDDAVLNLRIKLHAPGYRMSVWPASSDATSPQPLREVTHPTGETLIAIPDANRFRDADGAYAFRIVVSRADQASDAAPSNGGRPRPRGQAEGEAIHWSFESISVSLEGISR